MDVSGKEGVSAVFISKKWCILPLGLALKGFHPFLDPVESG